MRLYLLAPAIALLATAPLFVAREAHACGGCYHRASEIEATVVTGHRMVLSISTVQTVLWDQIEYDGDPSEFAWVLPVKQGARVEVATDAWFDTLDAATSATVVSPPLDCAPPPGVRNGGGCGASSSDVAPLAGSSRGDTPSSPADSVTVVHRGTVGPYETVTLSTDTPGALNLWLDDHGYAVDADVQPIIDAYIADGFDFIALRLQPGQGIRAMKPVRVISPGASPTLPLRMVAAGTGAFVGIKLFVVSEGRFDTKNFPGAVIPESELSWDHLTIDSNYAKLRKAALDGDGGRTWLTAYAKQGALLSPIKNAASWGNVTYQTSSGSVATIAEAYLHQAEKNGEFTIAECDINITQYAESNLVVTDTCPPGTQNPAECPAAQPTEIDARNLACGEADDLAEALSGLHPRDVWITRLEAFLPRTALATDLEVEPAEAQTPVENWLKPGKILHETEACRQALDGAGAPLLLGSGGRGGGPTRGTVFTLIAGGVALLGVARRLARSALPE